MENEEVSLKHKILNILTLHKRVVIIAGAMITLIVIVLIALTLLGGSTSPSPDQNQISIETPLPNPSLSFVQSTLDITAGQSYTQPITVMTQGTEVSAILISISWDPALITDVELEQQKDPNSALSYALIPYGFEKDADNGTGILTLLVPDDIPAQRDNGIVARLSFKALQDGPGEIRFEPNTALITRQEGDQIILSNTNLTLQ